MPRSLGRYELLRPLARGGMADVFLARRRGAAGVDKRLVLKRIRPERAADPRFLAMFVKEARLSVDLAHANIVPVFDFGRVGDELFLAMEYVHGRDLAATLRRAAERGLALDPLLAAHIGAEACKALDYAHRRADAAGRPLGIVHRDVTPKNVLLSYAGEVKLTDFGVASLGADPAVGVRGTPAYMSPEQARAEPVDGRSDLFSLGLVLAEAATGERVYRGADTAALLAEAREGKVPELPESIPAGLRAAVARATRVDRDARFADARAMERALDAVVVAARAADPARSAPGHELGAWLASLFPEDAAPEEPPPEAGDEEPDDRTPAVALIEDGAAGVERALGVDEPGAMTIRSIAETMADAAEPAKSGPPPAAPAAPSPTRGRAPLALGAIALLLGAGAVVWAVAGKEPAAPPQPAKALAADAPVSAAPAAPHDAALPAPAAAAVTPDAPRLPLSSPPAAPPPGRRPLAPRLFPVEINSRPWSRVSIDGRYVDDTPFRAELPAGSHRIRFDNPQDGSTKTIVIQVPRDRPVVENLNPP